MSNYQKIYETSAVNTGGRSGVSYIENSSFQVTISSPKEMGGDGNGTNPEQLFALGYSACFNSALEVVLGLEGIKAKSMITQRTQLLKADGPDFKLGVEIEVSVDGKSADEAKELGEKAHEVCPYSKATRGNIDVTIIGVDYDATKEAR